MTAEQEVDALLDQFDAGLIDHAAVVEGMVALATRALGRTLNDKDLAEMQDLVRRQIELAPGMERRR